MSFQQTQKQPNDLEVPSPPTDGVSSLAVNGSLQQPTNMLLATSWDGSVSCYQIQQAQNGMIQNVIPQSQIKHEAPVMCCSIAQDGVTTFSAGCDTHVHMWNVTQPSTSVQKIGKHDAPIRCINSIADMNMVATGSWDKSVKLWDARQPNPAAQVQLEERVYAMDACNPAIVIGTADRNFHVYDLTAGLSKCLAKYISPTNYQTRCISIFHDKNGFAAGSIEGRCAIENFKEMGNTTKAPNSSNFVFKCHRVKQKN